MYHDFARSASDAIARNPKKKMHFISVIHYQDETFMCVVKKDGARKYHLEDVTFIDVSGYNGRIVELTNAFERMYNEYELEGIARYIGSASDDVRSRFRTVYRRQSIGTANESYNKSGERQSAGETSGTIGARNQRTGFSEGTGQVRQYSERRPQRDLTVRDAMMAITDTTGMTEAERSLLYRYQADATKLDEVVNSIAAQKAIANDEEKSAGGQAAEAVAAAYRRYSTKKVAAATFLFDESSGAGVPVDYCAGPRSVGVTGGSFIRS